MDKQQMKPKWLLKYGVFILPLVCLSVDSAESVNTGINSPLSFTKAIFIAQKNDPWLTGNLHQQQAIELMTTAVNTLPDLRVSIDLANLPADGFDFGQESMTQTKVGLTQMFPRGNTLAIKSQQLKFQSEAFPLQRQSRNAQVAVVVGSLWLDAYIAQQSMALIEKNRSLFEQLADIVEASYASAFGKTRQQDIVRAQLELTRLEDRLDLLGQQKNQYAGILAQWLTRFSTDNQAMGNAVFSADFFSSEVMLSEQLPTLTSVYLESVYSGKHLSKQELVANFLRHPSVIALDKKIRASKTAIELAEQKYQPEWGVKASYGYRADDPMGSSRADLFSLGVTFDLPIFTENKQDKEVQSAIASTEAVKTEKVLLLRQLLGRYMSAKGRLLRLKDRQQLYKFKLIPQVHDQADASLTAYTNDDGDFSEVVRSRIAVLNAEIDHLMLDVEEQKIALELNYLFIGNTNTSAIKQSKNTINSSEYTTMPGVK